MSHAASATSLVRRLGLEPGLAGSRANLPVGIGGCVASCVVSQAPLWGRSVLCASHPRFDKSANIEEAWCGDWVSSQDWQDPGPTTGRHLAAVSHLVWSAKRPSGVAQSFGASHPRFDKSANIEEAWCGDWVSEPGLAGSRAQPPVGIGGCVASCVVSQAPLWGRSVLCASHPRFDKSANIEAGSEC